MICFKQFHLYLIHTDLISMVSCQKDPARHAYAWQIGPYWQDTLDMYPHPDEKQHWVFSIAVNLLPKAYFFSTWLCMIIRNIFSPYMCLNCTQLFYIWCMLSGVQCSERYEIDWWPLVRHFSILNVCLRNVAHSLIHCPSPVINQSA